jgi:hypothetical protein
MSANNNLTELTIKFQNNECSAIVLTSMIQMILSGLVQFNREVDTGLKSCLKIHKNFNISENSSKILKILKAMTIPEQF